MSNYGDYYKDMEVRSFLDRWAPEDSLPSVNADNLRYNVARANAAEHELKEIKAAIRLLQKTGK